MGATIADVSHELICLWVLVVFYFATACMVYGVEMRLSKRHARERLEVLRKKREVRLMFKAKKTRSEAK
jgi:ABC-2 type transport system permease protein